MAFVPSDFEYRDDTVEAEAHIGQTMLPTGFVYVGVARRTPDDSDHVVAHFSPGSARRLAAELLMAAERADEARRISD